MHLQVLPCSVNIKDTKEQLTVQFLLSLLQIQGKQETGGKRHNNKDGIKVVKEDENSIGRCDKE